MWNDAFAFRLNLPVVGVVARDNEDVDAREADRIFRLLMGDNVEDRRRFIEDNAVNVKNLDV